MTSSPHQVGDVMTRAVVAVGRETLFKDIVERIGRGRISALPVLEGDGRVVGIVSEAGLLPKEEFRDSDPDGHPAVVPVNYDVIDGAIVFRTAPGSVTASVVDEEVAFEVDRVDEARSMGWSVLAVG
ncbi:pyridoxamine 5'-phosphate oxidase family protein [Streptomyces sp. NPDC059837]|uniref:pyridoxamine 5'-phosphate oxidase family protein n=1 Tax=unclassified Streptomyces TaxID=2593676 RepID=UPI00364B5843